MKKLIVTIGILAVLLGAISSALAAPAKPPTTVNAILLCVDWSAHCQKIKPVWSQFIQKTKAAGYPVTITTVNCEQNPDLCQLYPVRGFPTIYFEASDGRRLEYQGPRDAASLSNFMVQFLSRS